MGKALAGGMSGFLLETYTPKGAESFAGHENAWLWIGFMALLTPIGMIAFRKLFTSVEQAAIDEREKQADEALGLS